MNYFCTKPTIQDLQKAEPLYLIFDKYIDFLLTENLTAERVLELIESCGVDACKTSEVTIQILVWAKEAKSIKNNYEIWTDGLTLRVRRHHTNWLGKDKWKWVLEYFGDRDNIADIQNVITNCVKNDMVNKHGWRKVV
jgi:hypothetical protein